MLEMRKLRNEWVHMAYTENGALTYRTTGSACLDLFGTIGAMRNAKKGRDLRPLFRSISGRP